MGKVIKNTTNVLLAYQSDCRNSQKKESLRIDGLVDLIFEMKEKSKNGFFANTELRKKQINEEFVAFKTISTNLSMVKVARNNIENVAKDIVKKINEFCSIFEELKKMKPHVSVLISTRQINLF